MTVPPQGTVPVEVTVQRPTDSRPVVADPDHIGPCLKHHSPVIWQGLADGRPTWRHQDGSTTQRAQQRVTTENGEVLHVPVILSMRPAEATSAR